MLRRARTYVTSAAVAITLTGALTACTGSTSGDGTAGGGSAGAGSSAPPAQPGKYHTLPEPCGAVSTGTLKGLLPGARAAEEGSGDPGPSASPYEGEPDVTYDTDRRVGCRWKSSTTLGSRHLSIDMERVVSYDAGTSDDEQAELIYDRKAKHAGIEVPGRADDEDTESPDPSSSAPDEKPSGGDEEDADTGGGREKSDSAAGGSSRSGPDHGTDGAAHARHAASEDPEKPKDGKQPDDEQAPDDGGSGSEEPGEDADAPSPSDSPSDKPDLSPRALDGIGDDAYVDDVLDTADSGVHRDVTLVFRTANVLVTVAYDQWVTDKRHLPDSAELQQKAREVAAELADHFDDD